MDALWIAIIGVLAAPVAALVTWFLNRKKNYAELYNVLSESSQTAVETMQLTMHELRIELVDAKDKIESLILENEMLRKDLRELKSQNQQLLAENRSLESKIEDLFEQIRKMSN